MIMKSEPCTLQECPPGLFLFGDCLGFKSEYTISLTTPTLSNWPEAFVVASGEVFWGGTKTHRDRAELIVQPVSTPGAEKADLVEAVARAIHRARFPDTYTAHEDYWQQLSDNGRDKWFHVARAAIAALQARAAEPASDPCKLPSDVRSLVIAAREVWELVEFGALPAADQTKALDKALEAFSSRVPYDDEPDHTVDPTDMVTFEHPDNIAVDRFAAAMKAKLAQKRAEGRRGWQNRQECSAERLSSMLRDHVGKGDPVDVANFAMMLHQREERISPAEDRFDHERLTYAGMMAAMRAVAKTGVLEALDLAIFRGYVHGQDEERAKRDAADPKSGAAEAWDWLAQNPSHQLEYEGWEDDEWHVHRVNGPRSDREWTLIARGETPLAAIRAAMAFAALPEEPNA